jgi:hypothetical protein
LFFLFDLVLLDDDFVVVVVVVVVVGFVAVGFVVVGFVVDICEEDGEITIGLKLEARSRDSQVVRLKF